VKMRRFARTGERKRYQSQQMGVFPVQRDIGQVVKIDSVEREATIRFDQREVVYDFWEIDEVSLAYAITIYSTSRKDRSSRRSWRTSGCGMRHGDVAIRSGDRGELDECLCALRWTPAEVGELAIEIKANDNRQKHVRYQ